MALTKRYNEFGTPVYGWEDDEEAPSRSKAPSLPRASGGASSRSSPVTWVENENGVRVYSLNQNFKPTVIRASSGAQARTQANQPSQGNARQAGLPRPLAGDAAATASAPLSGARVSGGFSNRKSALEAELDNLYRQRSAAMYQTGPEAAQIVQDTSRRIEELGGVGKAEAALRNVGYGFSALGPAVVSTGNAILQGAADTLGLRGVLPAVDDTLDAIQDYNDSLQRGRELETREIQRVNQESGLGSGLGTGLLQAAGGMIPNAVVAAMSGGGSTAAQLGQQGGSALAQIGGQLVKNPSAWLSAAQTLGPSYEEALASGADPARALDAAALDALLSSAIEVQGGLEGIPRGAGLLRSMAEEGLEEVKQGVIHGAVQNAVAGAGNPIFSTEDETAVLNPLRAGEEFILGAAAAGLMGAPMRIANALRGGSSTSQGSLPPGPDYAGDAPAYVRPESASVPSVAKAEVETAAGLSGHQTGSAAREFYGKLFDQQGGQRVVAVNGASYQDDPYQVVLRKDVVDKVASGENVTPEKLSLLNVLDDVVENGEYIGSRIYGTGTESTPVRYDYFKTPVTIDGHEYTAAYDVGNFPTTDGSRTHKVVNNLELLPASANDAAVDAGGAGRYTVGGGDTNDGRGNQSLLGRPGEGEKEADGGGKEGDFASPDGGILRDKNAGSYPGRSESREAFLRRAGEEAREVRAAGQGIAYSYRPVEPARYSETARRLMEMGVADGMRIVVTDGPVEVNYQGYTAAPEGEAGSLQDGTIFVSNRAPSPPGLIYGHERVHSIEKVAPSLYQDYAGAIFDTNLNYASPGFLEWAADTGARYFGDFDLLTDYSRLYPELAAFIGGNIENDPVSAKAMYGDWFYDWDQVVRAYGSMTEAFRKSRLEGGSAASRLPRAQEPQLPAAGESFGPNSLGAAQKAQGTTLNDLMQKYGQFEPGEAPRGREVDIPRRDAQGRAVNRGIRTISEAPGVTDEMAAAFEPGIIQGMYSHDVATDKKANRYAAQVLEERGYSGALDQWDAAVQSDGIVSKNDMALGMRLLVEASQAGDIQTAMKLAADLSAEAARAGQTVQAMRLLKRMTPEGQLYYLQRVANHLGRDSGREITLDPALAQRLLEAGTREEIDAAASELRQNIADQLPAGWVDKWNAWRYLAMLGNPRTQVRNVVGNTIFMPVVKAKNLVGQALEGIYQRTGWLPEATKASVVPWDQGDRALLDFAAGDFDSMEDAVMGGGKMSQRSDIEGRRTIFKNKALEGYRKLTDEVMERGDRVFAKRHYKSSLASWLKANGWTAEEIQSGSPEASAALERARTYAVKEAQKATFRDANLVAEQLNRAKRSLSRKYREASGGKKALYAGETALLEGLVPFTKTPANILVRGAEYSPLGLTKGVWDLFSGVRKGTRTPAEALDTIAAGLTGTGIMALGALLGSMGYVTGAGSEDDKKRRFDQMQGEQQYALNLGDYSYTIDWAAPAALPFFVGVSLAEDAAADESGADPVTRLLDSLSLISEPMLQLSMLQGVNDAFDAVRYGTGSAIASVGSSILSGYAGQVNPTILGQVARAVDETSRQTYYDPRYSGAVKEGSAFLQRQAAKLPFASQALQPRIDQWGRTEENTGGSFLGRLAYNMLSPGYLERRESTPVDQELGRLYEATGESGVLPTYAPKKIRSGGEDRKLTADQYTQFAQARGQAAYDFLETAMDAGWYSRLDDAERAQIAELGYQYGTVAGGYDVLGEDYVPSDAYSKALKVYQSQQEAGIPLEFAVRYWTTASTDSNAGISQEEARAALQGTSLTREQKAYLWALTNKSWKTNPFG